VGISTKITRGSIAVLFLVVQAHDVRQLLTYQETESEFNFEEGSTWE